MFKIVKMIIYVWQIDVYMSKLSKSSDAASRTGAGC